jgi:type I restriction enzyme S subunit
MNLPKGWKLLQLKEICDLQNGYAFKSTDYVNASNTLNCRMSSIRPNGVFDLTHNPKFLPDFYAEKYSNYLLKDGDVIIAMTDMATEAKILGVPTIVKTEGKQLLLNQRVGKLIIKKPDLIFFPYLKYVLNRKETRLYFLKFSGGGLQINLGKNDLLSVKIPLPPIASQRRIADILDKADEIIRKRKEAIALTEQLQKSIFLDMFGDPVINPKGWEVNKVIDYCDCIVPGRDKPKSFTGSIPWITTADLKFLDKTYFSNLNMKLSENEIKEVNAKIIPKNSVLLTCVGDLGVTSIAGCDMVVNQQLHSFQCKNINNYFLMYALPYQKIFMYKRATQTTVPYMNKNTCNSIPIIYPPRKLQEKFGILIAEINNKKGLYLKALQESENLFNSLLQKAFKGEL